MRHAGQKRTYDPPTTPATKSCLLGPQSCVNIVIADLSCNNKNMGPKPLATLPVIIFYFDCFQCECDSEPKTLIVSWWAREQILAEAPQLKGSRAISPVCLCAIRQQAACPISGSSPGQGVEFSAKSSVWITLFVVCPKYCFMSFKLYLALFVAAVKEKGTNCVFGTGC